LSPVFTTYHSPITVAPRAQCNYSCHTQNKRTLLHDTIDSRTEIALDAKYMLLSLLRQEGKRRCTSRAEAALSTIAVVLLPGLPARSSATPLYSVTTTDGVSTQTTSYQSISDLFGSMSRERISLMHSTTWSDAPTRCLRGAATTQAARTSITISTSVALAH
jgi:hypothetical protein